MVPPSGPSWAGEAVTCHSEDAWPRSRAPPLLPQAPTSPRQGPHPSPRYLHPYPPQTPMSYVDHTVLGADGGPLEGWPGRPRVQAPAKGNRLVPVWAAARAGPGSRAGICFNLVQQGCAE